MRTQSIDTEFRQRDRHPHRSRHRIYAKRQTCQTPTQMSTQAATQMQTHAAKPAQMQTKTEKQTEIFTRKPGQYWARVKAIMRRGGAFIKAVKWAISALSSSTLMFAASCDGAQ